MALSEIIKTIETFYNMHHTAININLFSTITAFVIGKFFNDILYFFKKILNRILGKKEPEPTPVITQENNDTDIDALNYQDMSAIVKGNNITNFIYSPIIKPQQQGEIKTAPTEDKGKQNE